MRHSLSFEDGLGAPRRLLDDALKGVRAAEAVLLRHSQPDARLTAINFPIEESLLREATSLLAAWKVRAAVVLRGLDANTRSINLQFDRLFDESAGRQTEGFLKRRVHLGNAAPEAIVEELVDLLSVSADLFVLLKEAKPPLAEHHRNCEAHLQQLVARRQRVDMELENAVRRVASTEKLTQPWPGSGYGHGADAASEEERRSLARDRQTAQVRDEMLRSERETLQQMIADDEDLVEALNNGIAAVNAMMGKLAIDIEQRIGLLKAAMVQSSQPPPAVPEPVRALIDGFDANILSGHDLLGRKQRADDAFVRRTDDISQVPEDVTEEVREIKTAVGDAQSSK